MLIDFRSIGTGGCLIALDGDKSLRVYVGLNSVTFLWQGETKTELLLDEDVEMDKDDLRMIVSFSQFGENSYIQMSMFEKTVHRGWIKKEIRKEIQIPSTWIKDVKVRIGDNQVSVKRGVITQTPMPESVFMPSSDTNRIYESAIVYLDADSN